MVGRIFAAGVAVLTAAFAVAAPLTVQAAPDARAQRTDAIVRRAIADSRIPGLQIAVVKDGKVVLERAYGVANLQTPAPVTDQTIFSINSITKAFTGVAAMREVEAGRLDLSKPVSAYLDDLPQAWREVTIRQLLSHTSGLPNIINNATGKMKGATEAEAWAWAAAQPMAFEPGERFSYNQTNYGLIQQVINKLEGRPRDATVADPQFQLVGMTRTVFGDSRDVIPGKAAGYAYRYPDPAAPGVLKPVQEEFEPLHRAASGLNSTADDMARWMIAIMDGRLLKPAARQTMWTPVAFNNGQAGQWGMGWVVMPRPDHPAVGMTGGSRAAMRLYPQDGVGVVILTNLSGATPEDLIDEIAALYIPSMKLTGVSGLRAALRARGFENAPAVLAELRRQDPGFKPAELELNDWGYRLLTTGKSKEGLAVLKIGAELYPDSGNAFDSLAEAYQVNGDRAEAIRNYRRSLELDPKNTNAAGRLKALETPA
ncbi:serine hydrolase domain-containing protein [Caulobacter sp. Root655]|uniref:serine hydrolase domain-containing protein n=1 Tax=Caulobacter sp. Root655 TaxID=1736578 RepID=UPI0009EAB388|nr:serine hydrolase domain-containing protein [Caulobacter sp. Root655]